MLKLRIIALLTGVILTLMLVHTGLYGQTSDCPSSTIMDPGYRFLIPSRGCAPFTVKLQTEYLNSTPGTRYYVDWGDGNLTEAVQSTSEGVILEHTYPNSPVNCGYDIIIDAENECNPRGSVPPEETQAIVWTRDIISINPQEFRVCQGFAEELHFADDSDWNCYPRDTRENSDGRWIQWFYGTGDASTRIPGVTVDGFAPEYPFQNPDPDENPIYPVTAPGQTSLPIQIPATTTADIGKEFEVTLRNWNQCNPYDNDIKDGNPRDPESGDFANGDNTPVVTTGRIVIVPSPEPEFQTRIGGPSGNLQNTFCIGEDIYFEDLTPSISGADFHYTWEFFDNDGGTGSPVSTSNSENPVFSFSNAGTKLVRLTVKDNNAAGGCEAVYEHEVFISPLLQAAIEVTDTEDEVITPEFCMTSVENQTFTVRFHDASFGTVTSDIRWRWEFYDENGDLFRSEPAGDGYSSSALGPFDIDYQQEGNYDVRLIVKDEVTGCSSEDLVVVKISPMPEADFAYQNACLGDDITFEDISSAPEGYDITEWSYDVFDDGVVDTTLSTSAEWKFNHNTAGTFPVRLTVTTDAGCTDTVVKDVTIEPLPEAEFSANTPSGCSELEVTFTNESWNQAQEVKQYIWEVNSGDGFAVDSIQSPSNAELDGTFTRTFINTGSDDKVYQIRMTAVADNGCIVVGKTMDITVTPGATAGFLYTNYSPFNNNCAPIDINFKVDAETQSLNPSGYNWEVLQNDSLIFDDHTGTVPEFSHVFTNTTNSVQEYEIRLTTELNSSCSSDSSLFVRINPIPSAEFTIDTLENTCDHMLLSFTSIQKGLSYYKWRMEAEDVLIYSHEGTQESFEYHFDKGNGPINLDISLLTRNLANCQSEQVNKTTVIPPFNDFIPSFTVNPATVAFPDPTVQITDYSTEGDWEYHWDFGNGETSIDPNLTSYTYDEVGDYEIVLTLTSGGCSKSYSQHVSVISPPPTADFRYNPEFGCYPLNVSFTNLSTHAESYFWEFGDGGTSSLENPEYTYTKAGIYTVRLTVQGKNGEQVSVQKEDIIEVYERPAALFDTRPTEVFIPDVPVYTRNLSENATSYLWDFGDGTESTNYEPEHYYQEEGQYDITLYAYNEHCSDSLTREAAVIAKSSGRVVLPNAFTPSRSGPNGIGENDVFVPLLADVSEFRLQIFNRWGELIFEGLNQGWDGYYQGRLCPQDVYVYKVEVVFNNGDQATRMGDVNLIR